MDRAEVSQRIKERIRDGFHPVCWAMWQVERHSKSA
jgi:hypothetical protein